MELDITGNCKSTGKEPGQFWDVTGKHLEWMSELRKELVRSEKNVRENGTELRKIIKNATTE